MTPSITLIIVVLVGVTGLLLGLLPGIWSPTLNTRLAHLATPESQTPRELSDEERAKLSEDLGLPGKVHGDETVLATMLRQAHWSITPQIYRGLQVGTSILAFWFLSMFDARLIQFASLALGPILLRSLLGMAVSRRERLFDQDYPQFLISAAGLLKTGLSAPNAIQEAVQGLEPRSLVKQEILALVSRLRLGVDEEQTIGQFARSIRHPEIELFIQALLLNRRIGGTLSETFYRLAAQARRRQQFRLAAAASVAQQRTSVGVITFLLIAIQIYLCWQGEHYAFVPGVL